MYPSGPSPLFWAGTSVPHLGTMDQCSSTRVLRRVRWGPKPDDPAQDARVLGLSVGNVGLSVGSSSLSVRHSGLIIRDSLVAAKIKSYSEN